MTRLLIAALASIAFATAQEAAHDATIHQEIDFKAPPHRVYEALLDARQFTAFSGLPAKINREAGGTFSLFEGHITGRNVELVPDRRIVQAWRSDWPEGVYSIVKFELVPREAGTRVVLDHAGFTEDQWEGLSSGWQEHYWGPLHKYLNA